MPHHIKNVTRTQLTLNIPCHPQCVDEPVDALEAAEEAAETEEHEHDAPPRRHRAESECICTTVVMPLADELPDGTRGVRMVTRKLPGSITFLAGETQEVPGWVAESAPVKQAVARGSLRLVEQ